ncbi:MAG: lytic transglycosylase F [Bacteroidia bacterium]|nr:MAG: lytic transglycosylase F [Bacteroidia bacterium]
MTKKSSVKHQHFFFLYTFLVSFFFIISCAERQKSADETILPSKKDKISVIEHIKEKGELVALTDFNSTDYFVYRGTPMGYQFDLLQVFADYLNVKLTIKINNNMKESFEMLASGDCDLIAKSLTITKERSKHLGFTDPIGQTHQILVQRKPADWIMKSKKDIDSELIRNQIDLAGKKVFVQKNTAYGRRLHHLSDEIGDTIHIIETERYGVEELIGLVATGKIDYTVCDENIALVNAKYYSILDVETAVSFPQNIAWATQKESKKFRAEINKWLNEFKKTKQYRLIYAKYFNNPRSATIVQSEYYSLKGGKISIYDKIIKQEAAKIAWDWRLLASLIYTESRFKPKARSWAGAYGLMQLMPCTFEQYGGDTSSTPAENIAIGVRFIKWLDQQFAKQIPNKSERIKFILAAYNVGFGHIEDAQRLAKKYGKNPTIWNKHTEKYLALKSNPKFYRDEVVKYGYCRGRIPTIYVSEILDRYEHYIKLVKK